VAKQRELSHRRLSVHLGKTFDVSEVDCIVSFDVLNFVEIVNVEVIIDVLNLGAAILVCKFLWRIEQLGR
jgi:hypothetical protein